MGHVWQATGVLSFEPSHTGTPSAVRHPGTRELLRPERVRYADDEARS